MKTLLQIFFLSVLLVTTTCAQGSAKYFTTSIPMRDGKSLAADGYVNDTTIAKPTILVQTPYNKNLYRLLWGIPQQAVTFPLDSAKYHYVIVDWRGFYGSTSAAVPNYDRGLDGYDVVEWIARQRWSNGKIGTYGGSALGAIQFMTARGQPPHLICAVPMIKDYKTKYTDYFYGGDYRKEQVEAMERLGFLSTNIITSNPIYNITWRFIESSSDYADKFEVPMLLVSGWFDHYPDDVLRAFDDIRKKSAASVRDQHKLIFGPWTHSEVDQANIGELTFSNAVGVANIDVLRFFDYHLNGAKNGYPLNPVVKYYQLGINEWRTTNDWYSPGKKTETFYLSDGGLLLNTPPTKTTSNSTVVYDPKNPSPSYGAARFNPFDPKVKPGPLDIRQVVESRSDALIFTTSPFDSDFEITGPIALELFVSSDRTDTDVSVRLSVVYPDGRSMIMTDGIKRLRFRNGVEKEEFMTPGQIYPVSIQLQNLGLTILRGYRLRVVISSSDYPRFDINLNNGGAMYVAGDTLVATNGIYHDAVHPSRMIVTTSGTTGLDDDQTALPKHFELSQNYPNPFSASTTISFRIPARSHVLIEVLNIFGKRIATVVDDQMQPGRYSIRFDATQTKNLSSGIYYYTLIADGKALTKKMAVVR